jgi:hypothetical protein
MLGSLTHTIFIFLVNHKWQGVAAAGAIVAIFGDKSVRQYWLNFCTRFFVECWQTWKQKLLTSTAIAVFILVIRVSTNEAGAQKSFHESSLAIAVLLVGWACYHALSVAAHMQAEVETGRQRAIAALDDANDKIASREGQCEVGISVDAFYVFSLRKFEGHRQARRRLDGDRMELTMQPSYMAIPNYSHVIVDLWLFNNGGLPTTLWDFRLSMKISGKEYVGHFIEDSNGCFITKELLPGQPLSSTSYSQPAVDAEITHSNPLTRSSPRRCWVHFAVESLQPTFYHAVLFDFGFRDAVEKRIFHVTGDLIPTEIRQDL